MLQLFYLVLQSIMFSSTLFLWTPNQAFSWLFFYILNVHLCYLHIHQFLYSLLLFVSYSSPLGLIPFCNSFFSGILWIIKCIFIYLSTFEWQFISGWKFRLAIIFPHFKDTFHYPPASILTWEACCQRNHCFCVGDSLLYLFLFDFCIQQFYHDVFGYRFIYIYSALSLCFFNMINQVCSVLDNFLLILSLSSSLLELLLG